MDNEGLLQKIECIRNELHRIKESKSIARHKRNRLKYREATLHLLLNKVAKKYRVLGFSLESECDEALKFNSNNIVFSLEPRRFVMSSSKKDVALQFVPIQGPSEPSLIHYDIKLLTGSIDEYIACLYWEKDKNTSGYWGLTYKDRNIYSKPFTDELFELLLSDMSQVTRR